MNSVIGYPSRDPNIGSSLSVQRYCAHYRVNASDYFGNNMRFEAWRTAKSFKELNQRVNRMSFADPPQKVNAFYNPELNRIQIPAGILSLPFFQARVPEYVNYGGTGFTIAHEVAHALSGEGRHYDSRGSPVDRV
ncbi:hypothetical protein BGZ72_008592 [Mortierella alpina]|nr:hypothetical protein BGZ72_008592 [Mortierella alpina]